MAGSRGWWTKRLVCALAGWLATAAVAGAQTGGSQADLASALRTGDAGQVSDALEIVLGIPVEEQGRELRRAVSDRLVREAGRGSARELGDRGLEGLAAAAVRIGRAGHPEVIPALSRFPPAGGSWPGRQTVFQTLLSLGEPALRGVLDALNSDDLDDWPYQFAFEALVYFADCWPVEDFGEETYSALRQRIVQTLQPSRTPSEDNRWFVGNLLVSAIRAGLRLDDAEVQAAIEELASGDDAVRARGIANPRLILQIRREARDGLADPRPHAGLERDFRSGDLDRVLDASAGFRRIPLEMRSPGLRQALVDAVLADMDRPLAAKVLRGFQFVPLEDEVWALGRAGDTVAIPALARSTAGWDAYEALLEMADPVARWALGALSSPDVGEDVYRRALDVLAYLVDHQGVAAFDAETIETVRRHAFLTLNPHLPGWSSDFTPVWAMVSAMRLGMLLEDADARASVEQLASGDAAVRARGVTNPRWIAWIRREAQAELALRRPPWRRDG